MYFLSLYSFDVDYNGKYFNSDLHHFKLTEMGMKNYQVPPIIAKYQTPKIGLKYPYYKRKHPELQHIYCYIYNY